MTQFTAETFLKALYRAVDQNRVADVAAAFHPDGIYERPGYDPLEGRDAITHFYSEVRIIGSGVHTVHSVMVDDTEPDTMMASALGSFEGMSREGNPLSERYCDVFRLRDGKIERRTTFFFRAAI